MPILADKTSDACDERLALVMRATNDGIWDWDLKTNHVYFSPRWKAMLGYNEEEIGEAGDFLNELRDTAQMQ